MPASCCVDMNEGDAGFVAWDTFYLVLNDEEKQKKEEEEMVVVV